MVLNLHLGRSFAFRREPKAGQIKAQWNGHLGPDAKLILRTKRPYDARSCCVSQPRFPLPTPPAKREPCEHRKVENVALKTESQSGTTGFPVWFRTLRRRLRCHS
jgi:hypothetical protein